ncbi:hypothetical protein AURDEDRAFT_149022 [Auricularia subglabra TFB-10046 SS5]|nr:hypothetical protein AURDEDRAFT_149022 [Auricularia subglabra TFB-10046 SS5]
MGSPIQALPEPVRLLLLEYLDHAALDTLHAAGIVDWRPRSPWQALLPIELVQHILGFLAPASFYVAASGVCARWRQAGRSVLLLRRIVRRARDASQTARRDLHGVYVGGETDTGRLWDYLLVAAPLRASSAPRERPHRVCTLDFRACAPRDPADALCVLAPRVFASDYAGVLVFAAARGLSLYSVDRLRVIRAGRTHEPNSYMTTLAYPPRFSHDLLLDISIAHQTSDSRHLVLFAAFQDPKQRRKGLLFRSDIYYVSGKDIHHRDLAFAQVQHTPLVPIWDRSWGKGSMPDWFSCLSRNRDPPSRDVRIQAIEPPHPCATAVAVQTNKSTYILLFDVLVDKTSGRALSPYQRYKHTRPHPQPTPDEGTVRPCPINPTRLLFAMSPGKHRRQRHNVSTDRSYPPMSEDRDAVVDRESFLEWFSGLCWPPYSSVLKSYDGSFHFGIEFCDGKLLMCRNKLTHNGMIFNKTRVELALPPGVAARPACVAALDISDDDGVRGVILVAAHWENPCEVHLYEVPGDLSSREHVLVQPRRLARFNARAGQPRGHGCMVNTMRFYGGVSRTWRGIPCESAALLVVIMTAGFVHICQLGTGPPASYYRPDWSLSAAAKLKLGLKGAANHGWRRHWTVQPDGDMVAS